MSIIYETTVEVEANGTLHLDLKDMPFKEGTRFVVRLVPEEPVDAAEFKQDMDAIRRMLKKRGAFAGMTREQVIAELRRQREEDDDDE